MLSLTILLEHLKKEKSWSAGSGEKESSILDAINDVNQNSTFGCRNGFKFRVKQSMKWVCFYQLLCARLPALLIPCSIIAFKGFIKVIEMYIQLRLLKMEP